MTGKSNRPFQTALDPAIAPLVEELQRRGFRTLQSCSGHKGAETFPTGHLWIHGGDVSPAQLGSLACLDGVDQTAMLWGREPFAIAEIIFVGEKDARFGAMCDVILSILVAPQ